MEIIEKSELTNKKTCEILQINPGRYYSWKRKYKTQGMEGLKNHKSTPKSCPHALLKEEKEAIIAYALDNPDVCHRKLAYEMQNNDIAYVSPSSVYRFLKDKGLISRRKSRKKSKADGKPVHYQNKTIFPQ